MPLNPLLNSSVVNRDELILWQTDYPCVSLEKKRQNLIVVNFSQTTRGLWSVRPLRTSCFTNCPPYSFGTDFSGRWGKGGSLVTQNSLGRWKFRDERRQKLKFAAVGTKRRVSALGRITGGRPTAIGSLDWRHQSFSFEETQTYDRGWVPMTCFTSA